MCNPTLQGCTLQSYIVKVGVNCWSRLPDEILLREQNRTAAAACREFLSLPPRNEQPRLYTYTRFGVTSRSPRHSRYTAKSAVNRKARVGISLSVPPACTKKRRIMHVHERGELRELVGCRPLLFGRPSWRKWDYAKSRSLL